MSTPFIDGDSEGGIKLNNGAELDKAYPEDSTDESWEKAIEVADAADGQLSPDIEDLLEEEEKTTNEEIPGVEDQPSQPAKGEIYDEDETLTGSEVLDEDTPTSGENLSDENEDQKDEKVFKKEEEYIEGNSDGHVLP